MSIKEILKEKQLSQRKLAFMTGIAQQDINQAILGKRPLFPSWRKRIALALNMPEAEIFPEYENNNEVKK